MTRPLPFPMSRFPSGQASLGKIQRLLLVLASVCVLTAFVVASVVQPDPRGFGTHQQFGLPPCTFQMVFNIPCPSCGGTTSFAYFVRGLWMNSLQANPAGFALALLGTLFVPWSWISCWCGHTVGLRSPWHVLFWLLVFLSLLAAGQWCLRVLAG